MTAKTMAEVLAEHSLLSHGRTGTYACSNPDCGWQLRYRTRMDDLMRGVDVVVRDFTAHQAAALTDAGFGLVADAKGEAWDEVADVIKSGDFTVPNNSWANTGLSDLATWDEVESILRARAAAVRGEG